VFPSAKFGTLRLIHAQNGQKIRYDAFHDAWEAAAAAEKEGIEPFRFRSKGDKRAA